MRETDALVDLYVDGEVISTTGEHPFWTPDQGWVEAKDLHVGSLLQTEDGRVIDVDGVEKREGQFQVYNFNVEGFHTYYVSDLGVLVHNTCSDITTKSWESQINQRGTINIGGQILPARVSGDPTHGILVNPETGHKILVSSGRGSKYAKEVIKTLGGSGNLNNDIVQSLGHAEGNAAAFLKTRPDVKIAEITINNNYVCGFCTRGLQNILLPGQTLIVKYSTDGGNTILSQLFTGK